MKRLRTSAWRQRRRFLGTVRRITRWEFWPPWAAYIPVLPYLLYLAWKHRSLTLFTCANPGITSGGFVGECKSRILSMLPDVPAFTVISSSLPVSARLKAAKSFLALQDCSYPVVLKPDIGERGRGVTIIGDEGELRSCLRAGSADMIIQKYVGGLEFGIFYFRHPTESVGHILSITEKRFPQVIGDGRTNIGDLILQDERAVCLEPIYLSQLSRESTDVPREGEAVSLAE